MLGACSRSLRRPGGKEEGKKKKGVRDHLHLKEKRRGKRLAAVWHSFKFSNSASPSPGGKKKREAKHCSPISKNEGGRVAEPRSAIFLQSPFAWDLCVGGEEKERRKPDLYVPISRTGEEKKGGKREMSEREICPSFPCVSRQEKKKERKKNVAHTERTGGLPSRTRRIFLQSLPSLLKGGKKKGGGTVFLPEEKMAGYCYAGLVKEEKGKGRLSSPSIRGEGGKSRPRRENHLYVEAALSPRKKKREKGRLAKSLEKWEKTFSSRLAGGGKGGREEVLDQVGPR